MPLAIGSVLEGRYRLDALLGTGGMGAVYRAWDNRLDQPVALKENVTASPASARQFEREAKIMAGLRHPNLPRVMDHFVTSDGSQYLVMDFVDGEDLGQMVLRLGPLDEAHVLNWIEQVCDALSYLHSQNPPIIHRDVKPANIKITPRGEIYLVDFGIAKAGDARERTTTGAFGVTPGFSPPEQYGAGGTDARSDIYALGATLYALLTGLHPPESVLRTIKMAQLMPPRTLRPGLSASIEAAVEAALQTSPTDRPQSVAAFRELLRRSVRESPASPVAAPLALEKTTVVPPAPEAGRRAAKGGAESRRGRRVSGKHSQSIAAAHRPSAVWWLGGAGGLLMLAALVAIGLAAWPALRERLRVSEPVPAGGHNAGEVWLRAEDSTNMVYVPGGVFDMGSSPDAIMGALDLCSRYRDECPAEWLDYEQPVHPVELTAFWIDSTEVTNGQYRQCVEAGVCEPPGQLDSYTRARYFTDPKWNEYPVIYVNWEQASTYCEWVGARLPTEAEWEYAARGAAGRVFPWGNEFHGRSVNYCDAMCDLGHADERANDGHAETAPVGAYPEGRSWCGAFDLAGNVWEWVADWAVSYPAERVVNPQGPPTGGYRIARGGSWRDPPMVLRSAFRNRVPPEDRYDNGGFRCARNE